MSESSGTQKLANMDPSTFAPRNPLEEVMPKVSENPVPEFSIITCSPPKNDHKFQQMSAIYANALAGETYEIIRISDAKSIAEGYLRGIAASRGRAVIFSHDDAAPLRPLAARLRRHLRVCDIVGGAGSDRLDGPAWFTAGPPHVFGQVLNQVPAVKGAAPLLLSIYGVPSALVQRVQALDGFWIACNRSVLDKVTFDPETCGGFHLYDVDFSHRAFQAGLNVGVACDLGLMHASSGGYGDPNWKPAAEKWLAKHGAAVNNHQPTGFQFAAVTGHDVNLMLNVMDAMVERTR